MKTLNILAAAAISLSAMTCVGFAQEAPKQTTTTQQLDKQPTGSIEACSDALFSKNRCAHSGQNNDTHYPSAPSFPQFGI